MTWVPRTLADICNPRRTALVVYDMQVGICSQVKGSEAIVDACALAITAARTAGMRIAYTRHLSAPKAWMGSTQLRTAMAWQHTDDLNAVTPWFLRDAPASAIVPALAPQPDDLVIDKLCMSAFEGTPLAYALHDCGITGVVLCGIALEIGIAPTARHAPDLGFVPIVLTDACGFGNAEAAERSLATMTFIGEAMLTDVAGFTAALSSG